MEDLVFKGSMVLGPLAVSGMLLLLIYVLVMPSSRRLPFWPVWVLLSPAVAFVAFMVCGVVAMAIMVSVKALFL